MDEKNDRLLLTIGGVTLPISHWATKYGLKYWTVRSRVQRGDVGINAVRALGKRKLK